MRAYENPQRDKILADVTSNDFHRLKEQLRNCFRTDRRFWGGDQHALDLPSFEEGLKLCRLSTVIDDAPHRFWLHQCFRYDREKTFITFSEPLFFFSRSLRSYIRLLDVDYDHPLEGNERELTKQAMQEFTRGFKEAGVDPASASLFVSTLELMPVRHYVPAGDSFGASAIRGWFREKIRRERWLIENDDERDKDRPRLEKPPRRKEISKISDHDRLFSNLIVLASRCTNAELANFQARTPEVDIKLTREGISYKGVEICDKVYGDEGTIVAHVVVTNWVSETTNNAFTAIASNHTRALGAVCDYLVNGNMPPEKLVREDGMIPERIQLAFRVKVTLNEFFADRPELIEGPLIYDHRRSH